MTLNRQLLEQSYVSLRDNANQNATARALMVYIMTIAEAARFHPLDQAFRQVFDFSGGGQRTIDPAQLDANAVAVFGATAHLVGEYGLGVMSTYGKLIGVCYAVALLFLLLLAVALKAFTGLSLWKFVRYTREEMALALGTASSESVMGQQVTVVLMLMLTSKGGALDTGRASKALAGEVAFVPDSVDRAGSGEAPADRQVDKPVREADSVRAD